jgi:hypothetical protein
MLEALPNGDGHAHAHAQADDSKLEAASQQGDISRTRRRKSKKHSLLLNSENGIVVRSMSGQSRTGPLSPGLDMFIRQTLELRSR